MLPPPVIGFSSAQIVQWCEMSEFCPIPGLCCKTPHHPGQLQQQHQALKGQGDLSRLLIICAFPEDRCSPLKGN